MLTQNEIARIGRYINEMADSDEIAWVEQFFTHGHGNQNLKHHLEKDWENTLHETYGEDINLTGVLDRVHHLIREKESQKRKSFIYRMTKVYMKAAAVLLLPLIIAGGAWGFLRGSLSISSNQKSNFSIFAPVGSRVSFNLPDGTKGWLNSGSTLTYPVPFSENRKVTLEGEAWFDVFHDEKQPFEVSAGSSTIKVLGTSFNVSAYLDEKYVEVVLQSGKVEFSDKSQTENINLKPSEQLIIEDGKINVSSVDVSKYKAWTDGRLVFRGDNMAEVARRIERWYNVNVEITDKDLVEFSFRAIFEDDSLEDVLKQLSMTSPIGYKIHPRRQLQDGTFEKPEITLYKKRK